MSSTVVYIFLSYFVEDTLNCARLSVKGELRGVKSLQN